MEDEFATPALGLYVQQVRMAFAVDRVSCLVEAGLRESCVGR